MREPWAFWSAAGSGSATPLLAQSRDVAGMRERGLRRSAPSTLTLCRRSPSRRGHARQLGAVFRSAAGSGSAIAALACVEEIGQLGIAVGMREPGEFWSAAGSESATPLWLALRRSVSWERIAEGSESAVDADALPAQSKAVAGMREPWAFWSAAGSGSATPLWLALRRPVSWKRVAEGSESAVDADALPAQSKAVAGMREPWAFWSAAGSGSATPLWLAVRRPVSWERVAEGSESAVDADALPAQSKAVAGMREPWAFWSAAGSEAPRRFGLR